MDSFIVSARKYRPATFGDVVGQRSITTTLKNSIVNNHLGHAYLFSGPRGVGKTTCARIFAKTINCSDISAGGEACNRCESCKAFSENRSYSIHELDAASNNSVDDIRTLTEQVRIPPQVGSYSIYIIDEVHMLSQSAFNAFLKTLEEPPAHAVFVLATTEKHKIIPTILSRCQILDFHRIRIDDAVAYLKGIADAESIEFEEDAFHVIAQKADGAMRDALSIFDQVVSFSGGKVTYQDVVANLNVLDYDYYFNLTGSLWEGDIPAALLLFDEVLSKGFDARNFINGYAAHLRDLMVCKNPETIPLLEVGAGIREKYLEQAGTVPLEFIYHGLEICNQADLQFRTSRNQRLTIELAMMQIGRMAGNQKKKELTEQQPAVEDDSGQGGHSAKGAGEEKVRAASSDESDRGGSVVRKPTISIRETVHGKATDLQEDASLPEGKACEDPVGQREEQTDPEQVRRAWDGYADTIETSKPRVHSTLKNNRPEVKPDGTILVRLNTEAQRDHFTRNIQAELTEYIRRSTGNTALEVVAELTQNESNGKKIYTDQDKLDYLMKKNPELGRLKTRFNLDFDE